MNRYRLTGPKPLWYKGFTLFLLFVVIQGALRKWVFPGWSGPLYAAKDVVLLVVIILYVMQYGVQIPKVLKQGLFPFLLISYSVIVFLQSWNINLAAISIGILGLKSYLLYLSLLAIVPKYLELTEESYFTLRNIILFLVVPVLILGIYQFFQPVDSWINQYISDDMNVAGVMDRARITGTFSYIGGMSSFLLYSLFLGVGLMVAGVRFDNRQSRYLGFFLLLLSLITAPMNGSRAVIYSFLIPMPFILWVLVSSGVANVFRIGLVIAIFLSLFMFTESDVLKAGWETYTYRTETASDRDTRVGSMLMDPVQKIDVGGVAGYGAGATHQGAGAVSSAGRVNIKGVYYEGEPGRVIIELGVIGFFFYFALKCYLTWIAWKALLIARSPWELLLSTASFCFLLSSIFAGSIVFNHVHGSIFWFCAGCAVWVWNRNNVHS